MTPFSLTEIVPEISVVKIVDIGAMLIEPEPYAPLLSLDLASVVGFEPNPKECEKLRHTHGKPHRYYPYFIGDGGPATFYETNMTMTGSLYRPNRVLLEKFQNLHELTTLQRTHTVETKRLDDIEEIGDVDLIKIDTQGAELDIFRGATKALATATLIQTEVEFLEMYEGQPLFADVDVYLRGAGYQFHTFCGFGKRCFKPLLVNDDPNRGLRQFLWSDALYVRDFLNLKDVEEDKLLKLALMLHDLYQSFDFCLYVLTEVDRRNGGSLAETYARKLAGVVAT